MNCPKCGGSGTIQPQYSVAQAQAAGRAPGPTPCSKCRGTGSVPGMSFSELVEKVLLFFILCWLVITLFAWMDGTLGVHIKILITVGPLPVLWLINRWLRHLRRD